MLDWINRLFRWDQQYSLVDSVPHTEDELLVPGSYPEESVNASNRNSMNSSNIRNYIQIIKKWFNIIILEPIIIVMVVFFRLMAKLIKLIYFESDGKRRRSASTPTTSIKNLIINEPINEVNSFTRMLEGSLEPVGYSSSSSLSGTGSCLPPFFLGSYSQALFMATNKAKFLFVFFTNMRNENSSIFLNRLLVHPKLVELFQSTDFIIWGGDCSNPEAYQLANTLNVTQFPYLGILCLTRTTIMTPEGPRKTNPRLSLISKLQGRIVENNDLDELMQKKIFRKINKYQSELKLIRNELRDKYMGQVLLKQQNLNYELSLQNDRIKKKKKVEQKLRKEYIIYKAREYLSFETENFEDKSKIAVRLGNGERVTFYVPATCSIEDLFSFVEAKINGYLDRINDFEIPKEDTSEAFRDLKLDYQFKLVTPVRPRIVMNDYLDSDPPKKIQDLNCIYPNGLLIIEDL